jgi:hypothetical protein
MKVRNTLLISVAALGGLVLAACHHDDGAAPVAVVSQPVPPPPPPPPPVTDLDTAAVLAIVQTMTSESAAPFEVDVSATSGGTVVTPVGDETSLPMSVDET